MFEKEIVIDAKGHLMGRLAASVAKELLSGQRVVVVRVEQLVCSGLLFNRKTDYLAWKELQSNSNPRKGGPYHFKAPSKLFWKAVKGMVPRKTARGKAALERLKIFEGCPFPYSHKKKFVAPKCLKVLRLKFGRKSGLLGDLCTQVGWNKADLVKKLEEKRLARAEQYHTAKKTLDSKINDSLKANKEVQDLKKQLADFGF